MRKVCRPKLRKPHPTWRTDFITFSGPHYVLSGNRLYEVVSKPLYFGSAAEGSLLGYVAIGYAIDNQVAREVGEAAAAQVVFAADDAVVGSTLDPNRIKEFMQRESSLPHGTSDGADVRLGNERFMEASRRALAGRTLLECGSLFSNRMTRQAAI